MKWFVNVTLGDIDQVRALFHKLCLKLHPDKGGNRYDFEEMFKEYESILDAVKSGVYEQAKTTIEYEHDLAVIIDELMKYKEITIDLVGRWIWVTGNTYKYRENLKDLGLKWSNPKKAWYFGGTAKGKIRARYKNLNELYDKFGRVIVKGFEQETAQASLY